MEVCRRRIKKKKSEGNCGKWIIVSYNNSRAAFPLTENKDLKMVENGSLIKNKFEKYVNNTFSLILYNNNIPYSFFVFF